MANRFENREGQRVPDVRFRTRENGEWVDVRSEDIFADKTVVVFGLPGAFTPTCSSNHLPRFNDLAPKLRDLGVDDIVCISVNDAFVMDAWGKDRGAGDKVMMLADGNADFAKAMGLEMDGKGIGFGTRSQRYSAIIENGVIKALNVEKPMKFECSTADAILDQL